MNTLTVVPLIILFLLTGFSQLIATSQIDYSYSSENSIDAATGEQILNGTSSQLEQPSEDAIFNINMTAGFLALIIALVIVGAVAGIHVLGSGLSDYSVQLIHKAAVYYGFFGVFSALSLIAFTSLPLGLGGFFWVGLTLIYTLGFYESLNNSGGGS